MRFLHNPFTKKLDIVDTGVGVPVETITGNDAVIVPADTTTNNINVVGDNSLGINITGSIATNTLTVAGIDSTAGASALLATKGVSSFFSDDFTVTDGFVELTALAKGIQSITTDQGVPVVIPDASGNISVLGGEGIDVEGNGPGKTVTIIGETATTANGGIVSLSTNAECIAGDLTNNVVVNPSSLKAKLGVQTSHGIAYGSGVTGAIAWTAELSNGQLLIGSTGNVPSVSTITAGSGIVVTNAAGSITVASTGSGMAWEEVTDSDKTVVSNTVYGANRFGGVDFTLPETAAQGTCFEIVLIFGTWKIIQRANQYVQFGNIRSTVGGGGYIETIDAGTCGIFRCIEANRGWILYGVQGEITIL